MGNVSQWVSGVVTRYDADSGCYDVLYNDGEEGLDLVRGEWTSVLKVIFSTNRVDCNP